MADCPPSQDCGCIGAPCPPIAEPYDGEQEPTSGGGGGCCGCEAPSEQPAELPVLPECCDDECGCDGEEGDGGSADLSSGKARPPRRRIRRPLRRIRRYIRPRVPGTYTRSPGINPANGNLYYNLPVVHSGAYAPPSLLTYNSRAAEDGIQYGRGTAGLYNQTITKVDDDTADVIKGDGSSKRYTDRDPGTGYYLAPAGARNSLQRVTMSFDGWLETQPDGLQLRYGALDGGDFGRLDRLTNRGGQSWTLTYDSLKLSSITDPFNRRTTYTYSSDKLQTIQDHAGRVTTFMVDGSNDLTQITTPEACITQLVYDGDHRLTAYVDPAGNRTSYSYDALNRVTGLTTPKNEVTSYQYLGSQLKVTDPRSFVTTVSFDANRNITAVTNPLGQRTSYTWADNWLTAIQDANGELTTLIYETGLTNGTTPVQSVVYPDGGRFTYQYDTGNNRLEAAIDQLGRRTTLVWDGSPAQRTAVIDALGQRTTYGYNTRGQVRSLTDPLGLTTTYVYDDTSGNLRAVQNPLGQLTTYSYNAYEQRDSVQDPLNHVSTIVYDLMNRPKSLQDPLGNVTTLTYDANCLPKEVVNPLGEVTTTLYDANRRVEATIDALGNRTTISYDPSGNLLARKNPLGFITTFAYDGADRQLAMQDPLTRVTIYGYDPAGNPISVTNPLGYITTTSYDALDRPKAMQNAVGDRTTYSYDLAGNQVSMQNGLGYSTTTVYDALNRTQAMVDALGSRTTTVYDAASRAIASVDPLNHRTTTVYDDASRPIATMNALGNRFTTVYDAAGRSIQSVTPLGFISTTVYDDANRPIASVNPLNERTTTSYDAASRPERVTNPLGYVSTTVYDKVGRAKASVNPLGERTTTTYDAAGRRTESTNPLGFINTMVYDGANQLKASVNPLNERTTMGYDDAGQGTSTTDPLNHTTTSVYDPAGRNIATLNALGEITTTVYDAASQAEAMIDAAGYRSTMIYDAAGRSIAQQNPLGNRFTTVYDAAGRVINQITPLGFVTTLLYDEISCNMASINPLGQFNSIKICDADTRPIQQYDGNFNITTTRYDAASRPQATVNPLNHATTTVYDAAGQRIALVNANSGRYSFTIDPAGRTKDETDPLGRLTTMTYDASGRQTTKLDARGILTSFLYDHADRLIGRLYTNDPPVTFSYDAAGNRTQVQDSTGLGTFTYDVLNRTSSETWHPVPDPRVKARLVFYNNSSFDSVSDDNAIDTTKTGLLPGQLATHANLINYDKGINGVMIDIDDVPAGSLTSSDFEFKAGTTDNPATWSSATNPSSITISAGGGTGGSDRVKLIWTSGFTNQWLQVTVKANANTGLSTPDTFYFGNLVADFDFSYDVDGADFTIWQTNNNTSGLPVTNAVDCDKNGAVGSTEFVDWQVNFPSDLVILNAPYSLSRTLSYQYEPRGLRRQLTDPDGGLTTYSYDAAARLDNLINPQAERTTFSYDADNRQEVKRLANGSRSSMTYDAASRLTQLYHLNSSNSVLESFNYGYDNAGNRLNSLEASGDRVTWTYDAANQLTTEQRVGSGPYNLIHTYDPVGNRLVKNSSGALTTFVYDAANQLETSRDNTGVTTYTFDAAGNQQLSVAPANARTTSVWDDENRQTRILLPAGPITTATYRFDGLRSTKHDSAAFSRFVYDGQNYLQETDGGNATQAQYTNTPNFYGNLISLGRYVSTVWTPRFHLFDAIGSTRLLLASNQTTSDTYIYDAFGNPISSVGATLNPFRYVGEVGYFFDEDSKNCYVRARIYRPAIIRWLSVDPLPTKLDRLNYFIYVKNQAPNAFDPSGMIEIKPAKNNPPYFAECAPKGLIQFHYVFTLSQKHKCHGYLFQQVDVKYSRWKCPCDWSDEKSNPSLIEEKTKYPYWEHFGQISENHIDPDNQEWRQDMRLLRGFTADRKTCGVLEVVGDLRFYCIEDIDISTTKVAGTGPTYFNPGEMNSGTAHSTGAEPAWWKKQPEEQLKWRFMALWQCCGTNDCFKIYAGKGPFVDAAESGDFSKCTPSDLIEKVKVCPPVTK